MLVWCSCAAAWASIRNRWSCRGSRRRGERQDLERDAAAERDLLGLVDDPHAPPADLAEDPEVAEHAETGTEPPPCLGAVVGRKPQLAEQFQGRQQPADRVGPFRVLTCHLLHVDQLAGLDPAREPVDQIREELFGLRSGVVGDRVDSWRPSKEVCGRRWRRQVPDADRPLADREGRRDLRSLHLLQVTHGQDFPIGRGKLPERIAQVPTQLVSHQVQAGARPARDELLHERRVWSIAAGLVAVLLTRHARRSGAQVVRWSLATRSQAILLSHG